MQRLPGSKSCCLTVGTVLLVTVCSGQAPPRPVAKSAAPKAANATAPGTDDIEAVIAKILGSGAATKDEFETTEHFVARQKAFQSNRRYALPLDAYEFGTVGKCACEYNADAETMKAFIHPEQYIFSNAEGKLLSLPVKIVVRRNERRTGINGFGARAVFTSRSSDEFGVVVSSTTYKWLQSFTEREPRMPSISEEEQKQLEDMYPKLHAPQFSFVIGPADAKAMRPTLRTVLVGSLPDPKVYSGDEFLPATISEPVEVTTKRSYLLMDVSEVRVVDIRSGRIVTHFARPGY